jgi:hypothetical protein
LGGEGRRIMRSNSGKISETISKRKNKRGGAGSWRLQVQSLVPWKRKVGIYNLATEEKCFSNENKSMIP